MDLGVYKRVRFYLDKGQCVFFQKGDWWYVPETLYHRDDALLYIAYVMLIWTAPIPADRWHCSLRP